MFQKRDIENIDTLQSNRDTDLQRFKKVSFKTMAQVLLKKYNDSKAYLHGKMMVNPTYTVK